MIVIAQNLVLSPAPAAFSANNPVVGYHNLVTVSNIEAETEDASYPVLYAANESTWQFWRGASATEQRIRVTVNSVAEIDYVGLAAHNLGSAGIAVSIEGRADPGDPFTELVQSQILSNNSPYLGRFVPQSLAEIEIVFAAGDEAPQVAVIHVGKLLILQRRIYVGHKILHYNRRANVFVGESEGGHFLGRLVHGQMGESALDMQNITPAFFRSDIDPWLQHAITDPFFFAWRPGDYPRETGYAWQNGDAQVSNQRSNGMMQASMGLRGIIS